MPRSFEGDLDATGLRFGIIASRFNDEIVSGLLDGYRYRGDEGFDPFWRALVADAAMAARQRSSARIRSGACGT